MAADDVTVTMDDGVELRASIVYPADAVSGQRAPGRFPVVIEHTPYVHLGAPVTPITYFAEHGYICVLVRARGTGGSGGEIQLFAPREGQDGKAVVYWAARELDGSDGRVALIGCSYPGGIALGDAAAVGRDSPLKAVVASYNGFSALCRQAWMVGGVPTGDGLVFPTVAARLMGHSPSAESFFATVSADLLAGGKAAYDSGFYTDRLPTRLAQGIVENGVPVLLWSGWKDILSTGALRAYTALQNAFSDRPVDAPMRQAQRATARYQLVMGPWRHGKGLDLGVYLQWLETWLKGVDTGIQGTRTPMHLFESGSDRWINVAQYPSAAVSTPWYLEASARLGPRMPRVDHDRMLRWAEPAQPGSRLHFTTPALRDGVTLAGPANAVIYASSTNTNLQLIAKLYDVAPDGSVTLITKGAVLGSQRKLDERRSWTDEQQTITWPWPESCADEYLTPGAVYRFDIALQPRQWGVAPRHRLRLELTTRPAADLCHPPTNNDDPCGLTGPQRATLPGATYRILHGPQWPSALNLPQLPWKALPEVDAGCAPTAWDETTRSFDTRAFDLPLDWGEDDLGRPHPQRVVDVPPSTGSVTPVR